MSWSEKLWGKNAKFLYLILATLVVLFSMLGGREIWTQEHRWADIVAGMFFRHDFLHPYLGETTYYDKPLLSYWLIAFFSMITGKLSLWTLRLPSALAGVLAIGSIYQLGKCLKDKSFGLLAGWLLLTTFYFIFWARTSSADMLNMAGSLFAVTWYFTTKNKPSFSNYTIFFLVLSLTALCKGLVGIVVPLIAILPDLLHQQNFRRHLTFRFFWSMIPAGIIYVLPFWASNHFGGEHYQQSGLYQVYRENILRYFQPFDHKDPIYTYFLFLPIYLLPWAIFFIPTIFSLPKRWSLMNWNSRWIVWAVLLLFLFFTLSGSRRSYYVLPMVPFAILLTADWLTGVSQKLQFFLGKMAVFFFVVLVINFNIAQPLYYSLGGPRDFAKKLMATSDQIHPWSSWNIVLLDAESRLSFYLHLPPSVPNYGVEGSRAEQTRASLELAWPIIKQHKTRVIFITRKVYEPLLKDIFKNNFLIIEPTPTLGERLLKLKNENAPLAFVALF